MYSDTPIPVLIMERSCRCLLIYGFVDFFGVRADAHAAVFIVRDYNPRNNYNNLLDRIIRHLD